MLSFGIRTWDLGSPRKFTLTFPPSYNAACCCRCCCWVKFEKLRQRLQLSSPELGCCCGSPCGQLISVDAEIEGRDLELGLHGFADVAWQTLEPGDLHLVLVMQDNIVKHQMGPNRQLHRALRHLYQPTRAERLLFCLAKADGFDDLMRDDLWAPLVRNAQSDRRGPTYEHQPEVVSADFRNYNSNALFPRHFELHLCPACAVVPQLS